MIAKVFSQRAIRIDTYFRSLQKLNAYWKQAIKKEVDSLLKKPPEGHGVLVEADISDVGPDDELIPAKLTLEQKDYEKARIVACGNFQEDQGDRHYSSVIGGDLWLTLLISGL